MRDLPVRASVPRPVRWARSEASKPKRWIRALSSSTVPPVYDLLTLIKRDGCYVRLHKPGEAVIPYVFVAADGAGQGVLLGLDVVIYRPNSLFVPRQLRT